MMLMVKAKVKFTRAINFDRHRNIHVSTAAVVAAAATYSIQFDEVELKTI